MFGADKGTADRLDGRELVIGADPVRIRALLTDSG